MKALFVVEPNFLHEHVGVRRVIIHYIDALERQGCVVDLASPRDGQLLLLGFQPTGAGSAHGDASLAWTDTRVKRPAYDTIVVTTPWLCARGLPDLPGCIGIVYDMIPNLIASGCLRFSNGGGIFPFAHEHDVGYRYYLRNASRITCISESTRRDFLELYGPVRDGLEVSTHIPFDVNPHVAADPPRNAVLLVNVLDARKNLDGIASILVRTHARSPFSVTVVGKERTAKSRVATFFQQLAASGIAYQWHREADDQQLQHEYRNASALLFPSLYEGLGLPVLEAQQLGVPAITTNVSSLPEINMNADLCFDPDDVDGVVDALAGVVAGTRPCLSGERLRAALFDHMASQAPTESVFA